ncbi:MAG: Vi polysaccharide biosynthesis protein VipA/TviB [Legionellales bacterium]|nr:Vi polysaccharide biosynthesis protein VipA/TviB [Legionellales bacterium]
MGYVGLPLAIEFSKKRPVVGFDNNSNRVQTLQTGHDYTHEVDETALTDNPNLQFTDDPSKLAQINVFIVTVPTPIDQHNQPDFTSLKGASKTIGQYLKKDGIVIYESTVYPGATEEICVPMLEQHSGLTYNRDFFCGYSPERINPGDKSRPLSQITKITAGSTPETAAFVDKLYQEIITVGTYPVASIKVAEAAKVIENTQRDLNIALINEFAIIFNQLNIETEDVLQAAGTKWNFLPFKPGLVGGHCLGVDPYYLTYCAQAQGYHPEIILAGRRLNDQMGNYVAALLIKKMIHCDINIKQSRVLIMGLTFKENCHDVRNTRVIDMIHELNDYKIHADVMDPYASSEQAQKVFGLSLVKQPKANDYDAIVLAVAHRQFIEMGSQTIRAFGKKNHVFFDIKSAFPKSESDIRL